MRIEVQAYMMETELAILIKLKGGGERWVPLSVCEHIMRKAQPPDQPRMGMGKCGYINVKDWWARKEGLHDE